MGLGRVWEGFVKDSPPIPKLGASDLTVGWTRYWKLERPKAIVASRIRSCLLVIVFCRPVFTIHSLRPANSVAQIALTMLDVFSYRKSVTSLAHRHHHHHAQSASAEVFG
jgi:hypothetical protein